MRCGPGAVLPEVGRRKGNQAWTEILEPFLERFQAGELPDEIARDFSIDPTDV